MRGVRACLRICVCGLSACLPGLTVSPLSCLFARFPCVCTRIHEEDIDGYGYKG